MISIKLNDINLYEVNLDVMGMVLFWNFSFYLLGNFILS